MKMPAATKAGGMCFAMPDVCKVPAPPAPPVPTPFPNIGTLNGCESTVSKVLVQKKETVTEASKMPSSKGDEAGTLGGMVSNVNRGQVTFKRASSKVYAKGKKIVYHTAMSAHNGSNANMPAGAHVAPSQVKVFVAM
ncbi:PAAR-like domain-containing protein [Sorangium cellulosum]|nr:PAAR-like domain-containing protein [Sorangium cellulosum]